MGASGFSVGNRIEVETTEMKKYHYSEPLLVAEATGRFSPDSDPGVDAFGGGAVADSMPEEVHDSVVMPLQGFGRFLIGSSRLWVAQKYLGGGRESARKVL